MDKTKVKMLKMRADQLTPHPRAQREINHGYLKRLMDSFDLDAVGTIHAVQYKIGGKDGTWVVDGQHRVLALVQLGFGEWMLDVMVHLDAKTDERASELFLHLNKRLTVAPYDRFINEVVAGDDAAVGVNDIAKKFGLVVARQSGGGLLACPATLKKAYRFDDGKSLTRALEILTGAYGKQASALEGKIIEGAAILSKINSGNLDDAALIKKLAKYPGGASALFGDAKGRMKFHKGSLARSIAAIMVDTYNNGRRSDRLEPI